jgi:hypothetical protein
MTCPNHGVESNSLECRGVPIANYPIDLNPTSPREEAATLLRKHEGSAMRFAKERLAEAEEAGNVGRIVWLEEVCRIVRRYRLVNGVGSLLATFAEWIGFSGIMLLAYQGYVWFRDGEWQALPVAKTLYYAGFLNSDTARAMDDAVAGIRWVGVQRTVAWCVGQLLDLPTSLALICIGMGFAVVGFTLFDRRPE